MSKEKIIFMAIMVFVVLAVGSYNYHTIEENTFHHIVGKGKVYFEGESYWAWEKGDINGFRFTAADAIELYLRDLSDHIFLCEVYFSFPKYEVFNCDPQIAVKSAIEICANMISNSSIVREFPQNVEKLDMLMSLTLGHHDVVFLNIHVDNLGCAS